MTDTPPYLQPFVLTVPDEAGREVQREGDLDFYRPSGQGRSPAVLFVHGGPAPLDIKALPRDWPVYQGYGAAAAELGLIGATVEHSLVRGLDQLSTASDEVEAAVGLLRADPRVDPARIALWFFSGAGLLAGEWLDSRPEWLRCVALTYPRLAAPEGTPELISAIEVIGRQSDLPVLLTTVGLEREELAAAVDDFVAAAAKSSALHVIDVPNGRHGFDMLDHTEESRSAVREALHWVASQLTSSAPGTATRALPLPARAPLPQTTSRTSPVTTPAQSATKPATTATATVSATATAERSRIITTTSATAMPTAMPTATPGAASTAPALADSPEARVVARQLVSYDAHDLEGFLAQYSPTAQVYLPDGSRVSGRRALREHYRAQFESGRARSEVVARLTEGEWVVDHQVLHGVADKPQRLIALHRVQSRAVVEVRYLG